MLGGYWRPMALMASLLMGATYGMLFGIIFFPAAAAIILTVGSAAVALIFTFFLSTTYRRYMGVRNLCLTVQTIDGDDDQYDIKFKRYKHFGQDAAGCNRYLLEDMDTADRYLLLFQPEQTLEGLHYHAEETLVGWWFADIATNFPTGFLAGELTQRLSPYEIQKPGLFARKILRREPSDPIKTIPVVNVYATNMTAQKLAMMQLGITDLKGITKSQIQSFYKDFLAYDTHDAVTRLALTEQNLKDMQATLEDTSTPWVEITPPSVDVVSPPIDTKKWLLYAGIISALAAVAIIVLFYLPQWIK